MSKFRWKNDKDLKNNNINTLDKTHRNIMSGFAAEQTELNFLNTECNDLQLKINNGELSDQDKANSQIFIKKTKNKTIKFNQRKHKYIFDNSNLIFKYFNIKKTTENAPHKTFLAENKNVPISFNQQRIRNFFNKNNKTEKQQHQQLMTTTDVADENTSIVSQYLNNVDESNIYIVASIASSVNNICTYCNRGKLLISDEDGFLVCSVCAASTIYIPENEKQSYKEQPKEMGTFLYDRSNHFKEILAQFQAKETTYISNEVIEKCKLQIKKDRLTNDQLTYYKMREMLRSLGYDSKLYEHIPFIKNKLGIPPPVLSRDLEIKLCKMFNETLNPFAKHQDDTRCNYIHYYFALYKMYELLGETRYAKDIPMLKEPGIFMSQDEIWKNICTELNWKFIPTSYDVVGGYV